MARVGLMGGTFDPIHQGHLEAATAALECAALDEILLVPAGKPPHKRGTRASAGDRLEMSRLAAAGRAGFGVWDWEARRSGPSYTVDTLRAFRAERPADEPFLVLGWDAARDLRSWRQPEAVLQLAGLVVVARPGLDSPTPEALRAAGIDPDRVILCLVATPDVAATSIRRRASRHESLDGLVPAAVEDYIQQRGLYAPQPA
jgi:nicotinate-nucleotide adenylyltransferase